MKNIICHFNLKNHGNTEEEMTNVLRHICESVSLSTAITNKDTLSFHQINDGHEEANLLVHPCE